MPVKRIQLLDLHSIDYAEENSQRKKVACGIHHWKHERILRRIPGNLRLWWHALTEPAVAVMRRIDDSLGVHEEAVRSTNPVDQQLRKRLKAVHRPPTRVGVQRGGASVDR